MMRTDERAESDSKAAGGKSGASCRTVRQPLSRALWKLLPIGATAVSVALAAVGLANRYRIHSSLAEYDGRVAAAEVSGRVRIFRDAYGVPHVLSEGSEQDAYFGTGYAVASDRLFQMDLLRRVVRGTLAQVFGEKALPADRLFRTIMAATSLEQRSRCLHPRVAAAMQAYTAGVNAFLESHRQALPPEFGLLDYEPEPWQVADCLALQYLMAWDLNTFTDMELLRTAITERVGSELAREIFVGYPTGYPVIVRSPHAMRDLALPLLHALSFARDVAGLSGPGGSNAWAISGKRSSTGQPLLANDMHLGHGLPGTWYEIHQVCSEQNVYGVTIPGVPFVTVGVNHHGVAWGFTAGFVDDCDFYVERLHPKDPLRVEFRNRAGEVRYYPMQIRKEVIPVRGGPDQILTVRLTRHGPVISDLTALGAPRDRVISMRWAATERSQSPFGLYELNRARNAHEVLSAARHFKSPGLSWVFADREGNVGYVLAAAIPIRHGFDGSSIVAGWDGRHEWAGFVPFSEQPQVLNPPEGFVVSANNQIVGPGYPYEISHTYAMPDRALRIRRMLEHKSKLSLDDFERMQGDLYVVLAEEWVPLMLHATKSCSSSPLARGARATLGAWDYVADPDQAAPTLFHAIVDELVSRTFRRRLGEALYDRWIDERSDYLPLKALRQLVRTPRSAWFDDPGTTRVETLDDVLCSSFGAALASLGKRLGSDVASWHWGKVHRLTLYHRLGELLEGAPWTLRLGVWASSGLSPGYLNRARKSIGGSFATVNPAAYSFRDPWEVTAGASQRLLVDLGNLSQSRTVLPAGNSGHPASPHYDDQLRLWRRGQYRRLVLDPAEARRAARHELELVP
jgi:penicillin amidase